MEVSIKDFTWAKVANHVYTVSESSSELHELKIFMIIWHCWSQLKNVELSGIWTHTFEILVSYSTCWAIESKGIGDGFLPYLSAWGILATT